MKKPIHLYIFVTLSTIATLMNRVWGAFFTSPTAAEELAKQQAVTGLASEADFLALYRPLLEIQSGLINKFFALLLLALLVVVIVFLFQKKNELAAYTYIGYLFGTLLQTVYNYVVTRGLYDNFSNDTMRTILKGTALGSFIFAVVLFGIYFGLTVFFLLRKPKETPSIAVNATDI